MKERLSARLQGLKSDLQKGRESSISSRVQAMDENAYVQERLQDQIDWYDRKSQRAHRWFKLLRGFELIAATAIPFLSGYSGTSVYLTLAVGLLGLLIAVVAGLLSLNQFQERWIEYRTICEALKREKYLFLARGAPYEGDNPFPSLVERVESLIAKETSAWGQSIRSVGKPKTQVLSSEAEVPQEEALGPEADEAVADTKVAIDDLSVSSAVFDKVDGGMDSVRDAAGLSPDEVEGEDRGHGHKGGAKRGSRYAGG